MTSLNEPGGGAETVDAEVLASVVVSCENAGKAETRRSRIESELTRTMRIKSLRELATPIEK
jgi:hypothetical protein